MKHGPKPAAPARLNLQQWCGLVELAATSIVAGSNRVQDLHERIIRPFPVPGLAPITRLVYRSVQTVAGLGVKAASAVSQRVAAPEPANSPGSVKENSLSILNGICGDYLQESGNALAISMQIRTPETGAKRVALFVHGLCLNDSHWSPELVDAVTQLGFSPAFVRYNTGLSVRENGRQLAQQLQTQLPEANSLVIIAHSMGGLVLRAALAAQQQESREVPAWLAALRAVVYLGTPHAGAPLEQAGHWLEKIWALSPYASALAPIAQIRSRGIQDLRRGLPDPPATQAPTFAHYVIAASLSAAPTPAKRKSLREAVRSGVGDGLVSIASALAQDVLPEAHLPKAHQRILYGVGHLDLLRHAEVGAQLRQWLERSAPSD